MIKDILTSKKIKKTSQRLIILKEISSKKKPFTAIELHSRIIKNQKIDLATVYRILTLFKNKQLIREVLNSKGEQYFEFFLPEGSVHPHFLCEKCNKIFCLNVINSKKIISSSKCPENFKIKSLSLNINGICSNCT